MNLILSERAEQDSKLPFSDYCARIRQNSQNKGELIDRRWLHQAHTLLIYLSDSHLVSHPAIT